jgi:hypothetical protein
VAPQFQKSRQPIRPHPGRNQLSDANLRAASARELERLLYPLLRADDRPTADERLKTVSPLLATVLDHKRETSYLEAMDAGKYQPQLLFLEQTDIVERIREHPALLWKAANVASIYPSRRNAPEYRMFCLDEKVRAPHTRPFSRERNQFRGSGLLTLGQFSSISV